MKHLHMLLAGLVISSASLAQPKLYNLYQLRFVCDDNQKVAIHKARVKLDGELSGMKKTGGILNFSSWEESNGGKLQITYEIPMEDISRFSAVALQWKESCRKNFPEEYKLLFQGCTRKSDTLGLEHIRFPGIQSETNALVADIPNVEAQADPTLEYKSVIDLTAYSYVEGKKNKVDSSAVNAGLVELGRIYNLHMGAGIPKEKLKWVFAIHWKSVDSFLTNEAYQKKYHINNPNLTIIDEFKRAGAEFQVCGQYLKASDTRRESLIPEVKLAFSAKTVVSMYQAKGYSLIKMQND